MTSWISLLCFFSSFWIFLDMAAGLPFIPSNRLNSLVVWRSISSLITFLGLTSDYNIKFDYHYFFKSLSIRTLLTLTFLLYPSILSFQCCFKASTLLSIHSSLGLSASRISATSSVTRSWRRPYHSTGSEPAETDRNLYMLQWLAMHAIFSIEDMSWLDKCSYFDRQILYFFKISSTFWQVIAKAEYRSGKKFKTAT